jgi:hypothetical protein
MLIISCVEWLWFGGLFCGVKSSLGWWCFFCMKMHCLEAVLFHYSKLHQIVSSKVDVGICTFVIDILLEGISLVSVLQILILLLALTL